jgi:hypothetical protein
MSLVLASKVWNRSSLALGVQAKQASQILFFVSSIPASAIVGIACERRGKLV